MMINQSSSNNESWKNHVKKWKASGESIRKWCLEHHIPPSSFRYWKSKLSLEEFNEEDFVEILDEGSTGIEIRCKGFEIYVEKGFDEQTLTRCLKIIGSHLC